MLAIVMMIMTARLLLKGNDGDSLACSDTIAYSAMLLPSRL